MVDLFLIVFKNPADATDENRARMKERGAKVVAPNVWVYEANSSAEAIYRTLTQDQHAPKGVLVAKLAHSLEHMALDLDPPAQAAFRRADLHRKR